MSITVYHAVYGEEDGSHRLLKAPSGIQAPFSELLRYTDRPRVLAAGTYSGPALSGFRLKDFYALIKTFRDPEASRAGMVRSYALLTPLDEAVQVDSLTPFFALLPNELSSETSAGSFTTTIKLREEELSKEPVTCHSEYGALVRRVLSSADEDKPVIWTDAERLEEVAAVLWYGLWPSIRAQFAFRHGAGPQDLGPGDWTARGIRLIASPREQKGRWGNLSTVGPEDDCEELTLAESYLLRLPEGEPLRRFAKRLEVELGSLSDLGPLQRCYQYFERLESLDASQTVALAKWAGYLSPSPQKGLEIKARTLQRIETTLPHGEAEDIKLLRNFNPDPFKDGKSTVVEVLCAWVESNIFASSKAEAHAKVISECFSPDPSRFWKEGVLEGLSEAIGSWPSCAARLLWVWWCENPDLVSELANLLPDRDAVEEDLVNTAPESVPMAVAKAVQSLAHRRKWIMLYATALTFRFSSVEAFRKYVQTSEFDNVTRGSYMDGLRVIADQAGGASALEAALAIRGENLYVLAGELCAENPNLLSDLDVENAAWRAIWLESINIGGREVWMDVPNAKDKMQKLLESVVGTEPVDERLLLHLAATPHADLSDLPSRQEVWKKLSGRSREEFLRQTADGWVERFLSNPGFEDEPEEPLRKKVLEEQRLRRLLTIQGADAVSRSLQVFETFRLTQQRFRTWLKAVLRSTSHLNKIDAAEIGRLISRRGWHLSASFVYRQAAKRGDLHPALQECRDVLPFLDSFFGMLRGTLDASSIGPDDWWQALTETVIQLYPEGIEVEKVWARAGGDLSAINMNQSGRAQWEEALRKLRHGGAGNDISVEQLLNVVKEDYPNNSRLRLLAEEQRKILGDASF